MGQSLDVLADKVKSLRVKQKLTQPQLAEKAQVNLNTVYRLERKLGSPSWSTIGLIADALGVDPASLISTKKK
jgi:transcriptional regulator with XRE-family HTH domain